MNSRGRQIATVGAIVVVGALGWMAIAHFGWGALSHLFTREVPELSLEETARRLNADLPVMIDAETRLDTTEAVGTEFHYRYTLVNQGAGDVDGPGFAARLQPHLRKTACANAQMREFLASGVTAVYDYRVKDGSGLASIRVALSDCTGS